MIESPEYELTRLNWSWLLMLDFNLSDHICLQLPINDLSEWRILELNFDCDRMKLIIDYRFGMSLMLGLSDWNLHEGIVMFFSFSFTLSYEKVRRSKLSHTDGY